jgi:hypothetical protein
LSFKDIGKTKLRFGSGKSALQTDKDYSMYAKRIGNKNVFWGIRIFAVLALASSLSCDGAANRAPDDFSIKYVGRQRLESQLRDPGSLEIIEERVVRPGRNGGEVGYYAKYRARNGFGGYNVEEFYTE